MSAEEPLPVEPKTEPVVVEPDPPTVVEPDVPAATDTEPGEAGGAA